MNTQVRTGLGELLFVELDRSGERRALQIPRRGLSISGRQFGHLRRRDFASLAAGAAALHT